MSAPGAVAWIPLAPNILTDPMKSIHTFEINRNSIFLAENEPEAAESGSQSTAENKDQVPNSAAAETDNRGRSSNDAESKPIKPFKPSEEIAAEQAVDFPVDI